MLFLVFVGGFGSGYLELAFRSFFLKEGVGDYKLSTNDMCILYMYVCIHRDQQPLRGQQRQDDQGWREIHAAVALTSLAQGQSCTADQSSAPVSSAATGQSYTRGPLSVAKTTITDGMSNTGSASGLQQSCATGPALTNRIIQKSSHISEVQTVKVSLANSV